MADRFWVGGGPSTAWAATANTNWSATSGGAGNASVPGASDVAIFDANSPIGTANISASITVQKMITTGWAGTITHGAFTLTLNTAGDTLKFDALTTYTPAWSTSVISITTTSGVCDITSAGKRLGALLIIGVGGTVRLLDDLKVDASSLGSLTLTSGAFNANGFNVTATAFVSSAANVRTLTMGSGQWSIGKSSANPANIWNILATNLTFNKNTGLLLFENQTAGLRTITLAALTYGAVEFAPCNGKCAYVLTSQANTVASLKVGYGIGLGIGASVSLTVQGEAEFNGLATHPISLRANAMGTTSQLIAASLSAMNWCTIRDVVFGGAATWIAVNSLEEGGNTGIVINYPSDWIATLAAIKAKTDLLTFDGSNRLAANIKAVNDIAVNGDGDATPWGP